MFSKLFSFYNWYKPYLESVCQLFMPKIKLTLFQTFFISLFLIEVMLGCFLHYFNQDSNSICEIDSAFMAVFAAIFWLLSALVNTPPKFSVSNKLEILFNKKTRVAKLSNIGAPVLSPNFSQDLNHLAFALKVQSKLSALAAICAALSAILQSICILIKHLTIMGYLG